MQCRHNYFLFLPVQPHNSLISLQPPDKNIVKHEKENKSWSISCKRGMKSVGELRWTKGYSDDPNELVIISNQKENRVHTELLGQDLYLVFPSIKQQDNGNFSCFLEEEAISFTL